MNSDEARQKKYIKLTTKPVESLVLKMAVPTIIAMLITTLYNMVDTVFVGHISTAATAGVGIVFSLMAILQAVGFFFGHGSGNFMSRSLGKNDTSSALKMASTGVYCAFTVGVILGIIGFIFRYKIVKLLGATPSIMEDTLGYYNIILIGAPFITTALVLNNQLRLQGSTFFAMVGLTCGAMLNIILDPILIFALNMGVKGAATATSISQIVSFTVLLIGTNKGGNIPIRIKEFSFNSFYYKEIFRGGLPSLCRQGLASVATILLNHSAGAYGDSAIAAFSVVTRITQFSGSALIGFGQGFQPVCGFNFGAGLYKRVEKAFIFCIKVSTAGMTIAGILLFIFAPEIISLFRDEDKELIEIASKVLRYQVTIFPLNGFIIMSNMMLQNIGSSFRASVLAMSRQGIFFIPLILILPSILGIQGAELAQPISDVCAFIMSLILVIPVLKKMKNAPQINAQENQ